MLIVRHALQLPKPIATLKSTADTNKSFFMSVLILLDEFKYSFSVLRAGDEHATFAVFGFGTAVYSNTRPAGHIGD